MRWLFRLVGVLFVIVVIAVALVFMLPGEKIAQLAASQISKATGRQVTMTGETKISLYPVLGVSTGRVEVANADWSDGAPMLVADSLKIGVEPKALFGGDLRITGMEAIAPKILLERAADGAVNWELNVEGVAPSGQSSQSEETAPVQSRALSLTLDRALISDARLEYIDHGTGARTVVDAFDLDLRWPDFDSIASFDASLRVASDDIGISGSIGRIGPFIEGGTSDVDVKITAPGGTAGFKGKVTLSPQVGGVVMADLNDTARFLAALGISGVEVPAGLGRAMTVNADLSLTQDMRLSLRNANIGLDRNQLVGDADLMLGGAKPKITARFASDALVLPGPEGGGEGTSGGSGSGGSVPADGWPKAPIDASALALADGDISLAANSIQLGDLSLGKSVLKATLDRSRAVFALKEVRAYSGLVTGQFVINNRNGLSVGGEMIAKAIDMETFLADAMDISRFATKADASLKFLGSGPSVHAIMNSLQGKGSVKTGQGVISGFDLDKLMRSGNVTGGTTVFDEMSATFNMKDGVLRNKNLKMSMPLARAEGKGEVGLGARTIDYLFTPVLLEGNERKGLAIPVRIRGPWANPKILPDLEKAIDLNLKEEKKQLKKDAKKEVQKLVEKELGVEVKEGETLEDAVVDELEEQALDELLKLFD